MELEFVIDKEYDIEMTVNMYAITGKEITRKSLEEQYKIKLPEIERKKLIFQKAWDNINGTFSTYIEKSTGYKWFYPKYECVLSLNIRGASNWGNGPKVVRGYNEELNDKFLRITAHELILSHYFEIYKRHYSSESLTDGQVWALAEIAAFALTSLTKEVKEWWPDYTEYYTNHNYPHIVKLQNELKAVFIESVREGSFDNYIKKGIDLVREYPEMSPMGLVPLKS
jgi:hypothetical protein